MKDFGRRRRPGTGDVLGRGQLPGKRSNMALRGISVEHAANVYAGVKRTLTALELYLEEPLSSGCGRPIPTVEAHLSTSSTGNLLGVINVFYSSWPRLELEALGPKPPNVQDYNRSTADLRYSQDNPCRPSHVTL